MRTLEVSYDFAAKALQNPVTSRQICTEVYGSAPLSIRSVREVSAHNNIIIHGEWGTARLEYVDNKGPGNVKRWVAFDIVRKHAQEVVDTGKYGPSAATPDVVAQLANALEKAVSAGDTSNKVAEIASDVSNLSVRVTLIEELLRNLGQLMADSGHV